MGRGRGLRSFLSRQTALTTVVIRERLETNKRRARNVTGGGRVDAMYVMYMCGGVPCFKALSDGNDLCQYTYITYVSAVYLHTHQEGTSSPMVITPYKCYLANLSQAVVLLTRWSVGTANCPLANSTSRLLRLRLIDSFLPVSLEAYRHACLPASMMQTLVAGWRNLQALDERITGRTQPSTRLCSSSSPV
ncbi:hypothetical protein TWF225_008943 [Orbilia oligospora]|nr:hypothetical protein TWF225_008943 [Orbilia oligospora]